MLYWARIFTNKLKSATEELEDFKLYLLKYYVDDGNLASESLPSRARLINGKVTIMEERVGALWSQARAEIELRGRFEIRNGTLDFGW